MTIFSFFTIFCWGKKVKRKPFHPKTPILIHRPIIPVHLQSASSLIAPQYLTQTGNMEAVRGNLYPQQFVNIGPTSHGTLTSEWTGKVS